MTNERFRILINRQRLAAANILALEDAAQEAAVSGTASATISTASGSKSYNRLSPNDITGMICYWRRELAKAQRALRSQAAPFDTFKVVRS